MVESITELRKRVQEPVRAYNDVAGVLVGDRVSIHVTRLFLALGWSPTVATIGMLACGLAGSALLLFGGAWAVAGFALLFVYYVLDCVDGEVARYRRIEKLVWGFHELLFHLYVKTAFFTCLGVYAARATGHPWVFVLGVAALLGTLYSKLLYDAALVLVARYVILRAPSERESHVRELTDGAGPDDLALDGDLPGELQPFRVGSAAGLVRAAITNFDLSILLFLAASVVDLWREPLTIAGAPWDLKSLLLAFYGVLLPLDFVDRFASYARGDMFRRDARRLLRRSHHFRAR